MDESEGLVQEALDSIDEFKVLIQEISVNKSVFLKCAFFLVELKQHLAAFGSAVPVRSIMEDIRALKEIIRRHCCWKSRILLLYRSQLVIQEIQEAMKNLALHVQQLLVLAEDMADKNQVAQLAKKLQSASFFPDSGTEELVSAISEGLSTLLIDEQKADDLTEEMCKRLSATLSSLKLELLDDKRVVEAQGKQAEIPELDKLLFLLDRISAFELRNPTLDIQDDIMIPPSFFCPITGQVMREPVLVEGGLTYEKSAILEWFSRGNTSCPSTNVELKNFELVPNRSLENAMHQYVDRLNIDRLKRSVQKMKLDGVEVKEAIDNIWELTEVSCSFTRHVVALDGVESLVELLQSSSDAVQRNRILQILARIAEVGNDSKLRITKAGAVPVLLRILTKCHGGNPDAVKVLLEISETQEGKTAILAEKGCIISVASAVDQNAQARKLLDNLCKNNSWAVIEAASAGLFDALVSNLQRGDETVKLEMANALATKLELIDASAAAVVSAGVVGPLLDILRYGSFDNKVASAKSLQKLSTPKAIKARVAEAGALSVLFEALVPEVKDLQVHLLATLANLVTEQECAAAVIQDHDFSRFIGLAQHEDSEVQQQAIRILHQLAKENRGVRISIKEDVGTVRHVLGLLGNCSASYRSSVLGLVFQLSADRVTRDDVKLSSDTVIRLVAVLEEASSSSEDKESVLGILAGTTKTGQEARETLRSGNHYRIILKCLETGTSVMKENAAALLNRLTNPSLNTNVEQVYVELAKLGVMKLLKQTLQSGTYPAKEHAAAIFASFAKFAPKLIEKQTFLERILSMLGLRNYRPCAVHAAKCNSRTSLCIVEAGVVPLLIHEIVNSSSSSARIAERAMDGLLTLVEDERNRGRGVDYLVRNGVIPAVVGLVGKSTRSTEKAVLILERIFKFRKYRDDKHSKLAKSSLSTTMTSGSIEARRSAAKALMHLGFMSKGSTYTGTE